MSEPVIRIDNAGKRFGAVHALQNVTLEVAEGEFVGLLGPNGAGKSTLLTLLLGLRRPTEGTVRVFGRTPVEARPLVGSTPQETALPDTLRVREVLDYVGAHYPRTVSREVLVEQFGLGPLLVKQCGALSGGQRRRVSLALAFVGDPSLVVLDEPTTGLDVDARRQLWTALRQRHAAGCTIVLTSHHLEEIEALAHRVVVIDAGRIIADDTLSRIVGHVDLRRVTLEGVPAETLRRIAPDAEIQPASSDAAHDEDRLTVLVRDSDALLRDLVREEVPFRDLQVRGASLEEAFLTLTKES